MGEEPALLSLFRGWVCTTLSLCTVSPGVSARSCPGPSRCWWVCVGVGLCTHPWNVFPEASGRQTSNPGPQMQLPEKSGPRLPKKCAPKFVTALPWGTLYPGGSTHRWCSPPTHPHTRTPPTPTHRHALPSAHTHRHTKPIPLTPVSMHP